jgi:hypothetical protein
MADEHAEDNSLPGQDDRTPKDPALEEMERALWWASDGDVRAHGTEGLRRSLHEYAAQMRIDSNVIYPMGETTLQ